MTHPVSLLLTPSLTGALPSCILFQRGQTGRDLFRSVQGLRNARTG